jgi:hypothetical protein
MPGPTTLSESEISQYSISYHVNSGLTALGWNVFVDQIRDGWPVYSELEVPGVYVLCEESEVRGYELGSHGKQVNALFYVYGENDAQRTRLADTLEDMVRDIMPIYDFTTGNETSPTIRDYFDTVSVRWEKVPNLTNAPDKERYRSVVSAVLLRQVPV